MRTAKAADGGVELSLEGAKTNSVKSDYVIGLWEKCSKKKDFSGCWSEAEFGASQGVGSRGE